MKSSIVFRAREHYCVSGLFTTDVILRRGLSRVSKNRRVMKESERQDLSGTFIEARHQ